MPIPTVTLESAPSLAAQRALLDAAKRARDWFQWKATGRGSAGMHDDILIGRELDTAIARIEGKEA